MRSSRPSCCGLLIPATALAADGESTPLNLPAAQKTAQTAAPGASGGLVRTIVGLAIVLGVIYGLYWVLKQVKSSREATATGQGLQTVATLPLGTNRSLHLVRAGDEVVPAGGRRGRHDAAAHLPRARGPRARPARGRGRRRRTVANGAGKPLGKILDEIRRRTVIK